MTRSSLWDPLLRQLDAWSANGATAHLWLRDDDATKPTPALQTLAQLTSAAGVPAVLAVIPALAEPALAAYLSGEPHLEAAVHGYTHANHAGPGAKSEEFPIARGETVIRDELARGLDGLRRLLGPDTLGLYVPPWNRISPAAAGLLASAGYTALSTFGTRRVLESDGTLAELNTHVDIIDWRGTRGGRDTAWLVEDLVSALREPASAPTDRSETEPSSPPSWRRRPPSTTPGQPGVDSCVDGGLRRHDDRNGPNGNVGSRERSERVTGPRDPEPIGILTHHLVHDAAAWRFLEELFEATAAHPAVRWRRIGELIAPARKRRN